MDNYWRQYVTNKNGGKLWADYPEHGGHILPRKVVSVGPNDLPYFSEEVRGLKRTRLRAYDQFGRRSIQYLQAKEAFEKKLRREAIKYREKVTQEVRDGKKGSAYSAIRKLGNRPGETGRPDSRAIGGGEVSSSPERDHKGRNYIRQKTNGKSPSCE